MPARRPRAALRNEYHRELQSFGFMYGHHRYVSAAFPVIADRRGYRRLQLALKVPDEIIHAGKTAGSHGAGGVIQVQERLPRSCGNVSVLAQKAQDTLCRERKAQGAIALQPAHKICRAPCGFRFRPGAVGC